MLGAYTLINTSSISSSDHFPSTTTNLVSLQSLETLNPSLSHIIIRPLDFPVAFANLNYILPFPHIFLTKSLDTVSILISCKKHTSAFDTQITLLTDSILAADLKPLMFQDTILMLIQTNAFQTIETQLPKDSHDSPFMRFLVPPIAIIIESLAF